MMDSVPDPNHQIGQSTSNDEKRSGWLRRTLSPARSRSRPRCPEPSSTMSGSSNGQRVTPTCEEAVHYPMFDPEDPRHQTNAMNIKPEKYLRRLLQKSPEPAPRKPSPVKPAPVPTKPSEPSRSKSIRKMRSSIISLTGSLRFKSPSRKDSSKDGKDASDSCSSLPKSSSESPQVDTDLCSKNSCETDRSPVDYLNVALPPSLSDIGDPFSIMFPKTLPTAAAQPVQKQVDNPIADYYPPKPPRPLPYRIKARRSLYVPPVDKTAETGQSTLGEKTAVRTLPEPRDTSTRSAGVEPSIRTNNHDDVPEMKMDSEKLGNESISAVDVSKSGLNCVLEKDLNGTTSTPVQDRAKDLGTFDHSTSPVSSPPQLHSPRAIKTSPASLKKTKDAREPIFYINPETADTDDRSSRSGSPQTFGTAWLRTRAGKVGLYSSAVSQISTSCDSNFGVDLYRTHCIAKENTPTTQSNALFDSWISMGDYLHRQSSLNVCDGSSHRGPSPNNEASTPLRASSPLAAQSTGRLSIKWKDGYTKATLSETKPCATFQNQQNSQPLDNMNSATSQSDTHGPESQQPEPTTANHQCSLLSTSGISSNLCAFFDDTIGQLSNVPRPGAIGSRQPSTPTLGGGLTEPDDISVLNLGSAASSGSARSASRTSPIPISAESLRGKRNWQCREYFNECLRAQRPRCSKGDHESSEDISFFDLKDPILNGCRSPSSGSLCELYRIQPSDTRPRQPSTPLLPKHGSESDDISTFDLDCPTPAETVSVSTEECRFGDMQLGNGQITPSLPSTPTLSAHPAKSDDVSIFDLEAFPQTEDPTPTRVDRQRRSQISYDGAIAEGSERYPVRGLRGSTMSEANAPDVDSDIEDVALKAKAGAASRAVSAPVLSTRSPPNPPTSDSSVASRKEATSPKDISRTNQPSGEKESSNEHSGRGSGSGNSSQSDPFSTTTFPTTVSSASSSGDPGEKITPEKIMGVETNSLSAAVEVGQAAAGV